MKKWVQLLVFIGICCILSACTKGAVINMPENAGKGINSSKPSETNPYVLVSAGEGNTLAIKADGSLWAWGRTDGEQHFDDAQYPIKIMEDIEFALTKKGISVVIKNDGSLWIWGKIYAPDELSIFHPQTEPIYLMEDVKSVAMHDSYFMMIKTDGSLWLHKNYNVSGGLFPNENNARLIPIKVMDNVIDVSCAGGVYALKSDGSLWSLREKNHVESQYGQLNVQDFQIEKITDNVISIDGSMVIKKDHTLWEWHDEHMGQPKLNKIMDDIVFVSNGLRHSMAIRSDGSLWAWGDNSCGQLGNGKGGTEFDDAHPTHYTDLESESHLMLRGNDDKPISSKSLLNKAQDSFPPEKIMDGVSYVSCGYDFTMAIKTDGSLWAWGMNYDEKLGVEKGESDNIFGYQKIPARVIEKS